jgi:soluble lytic murein transglycosylase-like protein
MRGIILGLIWLAAGAAQADVYISIDAKGGYVLSNAHRPGRHYERVISEVAALSGPANAQWVTGRPYADEVAAAARTHDVPQALLHALIKAESGYNPKARSPRGALGLMQLMPETAKEMGVKDALDPAANVQGGARYLKRMLKLFDNDITLAVAAYNAGPDAVLSRGRVVPPFAETRRYVPNVLREYRKLQGLADDAPLSAQIGRQQGL